MQRLRFGTRLVAIALALAGCGPVPPGTHSQASPGASQSAGQHPGSSASSLPVASANPRASSGLTGVILDLAGHPAANVAVSVRLITDGGSGLVSDAASSVVSNNGGALVGNNSSNLIGAVKIPALPGGQAGLAPRALLAATPAPSPATLQTSTDASGHFHVDVPSGQTLVVEAVQSDTVKAIRQVVASDTADVTLQLAYTGAISGRVALPDDPQVTDLTGIEVFIPGTSYLAKTDASGNYTIANVPPGVFNLHADRQGLGAGEQDGVEVRSKTTTPVPSLALHLVVPTLTALSVANGGAGLPVTLSGKSLGASAGASLQVTFGGVVATDARATDDHTITCTVPAGAASGDVVAVVGGAASNPLHFDVIAKLAIAALVPAQLTVGQQTQLSIAAYDAKGAPIASPGVSWSADGTGLDVSASGLVRGKALGSGRAIAHSGNVQDALAIDVVGSIATVSTLAGTGAAGFLDGPGSTAQFASPNQLAVDASGTLCVADNSNNRVRMVAPDGTTTTLAGNGNASDQDGDGTSASLSGPSGLALDGKGHLYVGTAFHICRIDLTSPSHHVSAVAGGGGAFGLPEGADGVGDHSQVEPGMLTCDQDGMVYFADRGNQLVRKLAPDGTVTTIAGTGSSGYADGTGRAAQFGGPLGVALDGSGNLYVSERSNHDIRKVELATGKVTTLAGASTGGYVDATGTAAFFREPAGLCYDGHGALLVMDTGNNVIRRVDVASGAVTTFAGVQRTDHGGYKDGPLAQAILSIYGDPAGITQDAAGKLYFGDVGLPRIRMITP